MRVLEGSASLLGTLRARTRAVHELLEAEVDVPARWRDRDAYAALLAGFHSVYAPLERALDASPHTAAVLPDWQQRRGKSAWLEQDLLALGVTPDRAVQQPPLRTPSQVAGAAYVLEGATLGGAVVLRSLDAALPHRFFDSYGAERGRRWQAFRHHVDGLDGLDPEVAVASAQRTFAALRAAVTTLRAAS